jgi:hypothetical protein
MLKMANELLENKIIWLRVINFCIRLLLFGAENLFRGREFLGETWAVAERKRDLNKFNCL